MELHYHVWIKPLTWSVVLPHQIVATFVKLDSVVNVSRRMKNIVIRTKQIAMLHYRLKVYLENIGMDCKYLDGMDCFACIGLKENCW